MSYLHLSFNLLWSLDDDASLIIGGNSACSDNRVARIHLEDPLCVKDNIVGEIDADEAAQRNHTVFTKDEGVDGIVGKVGRLVDLQVFISTQQTSCGSETRNFVELVD